MATKTTPRAAKPLLPPEESLWERYSPHYEMPLAGATSVFAHGMAFGLLMIIGAAYFWTAREEAAKPAKMDVVMLEGSGEGGLEGLGSPEGLPGLPNAGGPKRTEQIAPVDGPSEPERPASGPSKDPMIDLGVPLIEDPTNPLDPALRVELAKLQKDAIDQANQETRPPSPPTTAKKVVGLVGTGNPKGQGGLGGTGGGTGKGFKKGTGTGTGGFGGARTPQQIFRARWQFDLFGDPKTHIRKLTIIGTRVGVLDLEKNYFKIVDLNQRPAELEKAKAPNFSEVVFFTNQDRHSIDRAAQEMRLPFRALTFVFFLPPEREKEIADAEARAAKAMRRDLNTVTKTHFEFQLRNGVYEPKVVRFE